MIAHDAAAELARKVLQLHHARTDYISAEIVSDHAWGLLLSMFIADAEGRRLTAYDVFARSKTPPPLGARWMRVLMDAGLAVSEGPCNGTNVVTLTAQGISALEAFMADAAALLTNGGTASALR